MLNKFIDYNNGIIAIEADGLQKYGLHILINDFNMRLINQATSDRWIIKKENNKFCACIKHGDKLLYMHDLITGIFNSKCPEKFLNSNGTDKLIINPYIGRTDLVRHKNNNGLVNTDDNLIISLNNSFKNDTDYSDYLVPLELQKDDDIYKVTLKTILNLEDKNLMKKGLEEYKSYILKLSKNKLFKRINSYINNYINILDLYDKQLLCGDDLDFDIYSIEDLCCNYTNTMYRHESHYYFDGHIIMLYPSIKILKANKNHLCCFSGSVINKDSYYVNYHLLIEDFTEQCLYSSKVLNSQIKYKSFFPTTVADLDEFMYKIINCYKLGLQEFYYFSSNIENDNLGLKLIRKK